MAGDVHHLATAVSLQPLTETALLQACCRLWTTDDPEAVTAAARSLVSTLLPDARSGLETGTRRAAHPEMRCASRSSPARCWRSPRRPMAARTANCSKPSRT